MVKTQSKTGGLILAYIDQSGDNARLLRRTVAGFADFTGRSRRTEVVYYGIASTLIALVFNFAVSTFVPFGPTLYSMPA